MTDYKQLCAELLSALENEGYTNWVKGPDEDGLCLRARAALAEPEPEEPTDEQLREIWNEGLDTSEEHGAFKFARAVLARWGNHPGFPDSSALQPVLVTERLPGPKDCDSDGKCWWFCFECPGEHSYWIFAKEVYCNPTHWLPASALHDPS